MKFERNLNLKFKVEITAKIIEYIFEFSSMCYNPCIGTKFKTQNPSTVSYGILKLY